MTISLFGIDDLGFWLIAPFIIVPHFIYYYSALKQYKSYLMDKRENMYAMQKRVKPMEEMYQYLKIIFYPAPKDISIRFERTVTGLRICSFGILIGTVYLIYRTYF